jgi:hypothetical protein
MDSNRHNAESGYKYKLYFDPLQQKITKYNVEPENTYNMDAGIGMEGGGVSTSISIPPWRLHTF